MERHVWRHWEAEAERRGWAIRLGDDMLRQLMWADDIVLFAKSRTEMEAMWTLAKQLVIAAKFTIDERHPTKCLIW